MFIEFLTASKVLAIVIAINRDQSGFSTHQRAQSSYLPIGSNYGGQNKDENTEKSKLFYIFFYTFFLIFFLIFLYFTKCYNNTKLYNEL